jgi:hypothetical protein
MVGVIRSHLQVRRFPYHICTEAPFDLPSSVHPPCNQSRQALGDLLVDSPSEILITCNLN